MREFCESCNVNYQVKIGHGPKCPYCQIARLRRALDNIKIRGYELGQREIHDMALAALEPTGEG